MRERERERSFIDNQEVTYRSVRENREAGFFKNKQTLFFVVKSFFSTRKTKSS